MSPVEELWGGKVYNKVLSCVEEGILAPNHGEKIAKKLNKAVFGTFNALRMSKNNHVFDKDEFAKILDNWYHTLKNTKERKETLDNFIQIC